MYHANLRSCLCALYSYKNNSRIWKINQGKNETNYCIYCEQEMLPSSHHHLVQIIHTWNETEREHHIVFILIALFHNCYRIILWLSTNTNVTPRIKNELLTSIFTVIRQMRNVTKCRSIVRIFNSTSSWSRNL